MKVTLIIYFNQFQFILKLYQAYKSIWEKFLAGLLIQCQIILLIFQSIVLQLAAIISNYQKNQTIKNGLINFKIFNDNKCFKWSPVRYLHVADNHPGRIKSIDKLFGDELDFQRHNRHVSFPVFSRVLVFFNFLQENQKIYFRDLCKSKEKIGRRGGEQMGQSRKVIGWYRERNLYLMNYFLGNCRKLIMYICFIKGRHS